MGVRAGPRRRVPVARRVHRLAPLLVHGGAHSPYAPLFALLGAFALGGILASVLEIVGFRVRRYLRGPLGAADGFGGAVLIAAAGLVICWIAGAVVLQTPGAHGLRRDIQRSVILRRLNRILPPSAVLHALARFDPFPKVTGPPPQVPPPAGSIARDPDVIGAGRSVVKVLGTACGLGIEGSGWVARGGGVVVTNAHVVAGESDTTVELGGQGPRFDAQPLWFDAHNDIAILKAGGLASVRPLPIRVDAPPGTSAAVLGFPENGPFDIRPARLGATTDVITQDAYGSGPVHRKVTALRGQVREVHEYVAAVIRRAQEAGGIVADRDADAEAWIFISLGLLSTIDHRLGNIVGDEFDDIVSSRREWMTGLAP